MASYWHKFYQHVGEIELEPNFEHMYFQGYQQEDLCSTKITVIVSERNIR